MKSGRTLVEALLVVALCPGVVPSQELFNHGFEWGRSCDWSATHTTELCDGRDNDCDGEIDEGPCFGGSRCALPAQPAAISGARVVGDGSPESCTEGALDAVLADPAATAIVFDCGGRHHTINLSTEKVITRDLVIDGGGLVALSGGGITRILKVDSSFELTTPHLVVQFLDFVDGYTGDLPGTEPSSGGAAIFRMGGRLTVLDCGFAGNVGPGSGQDVAGGAVYSIGVGETILSGCRFFDNRCSSGGAVGNLHNQLQLVNSELVGNAATGSGGNPGSGGNGGGVYMDGVDQDFVLCGTRIADNTANARGGGVFRVSNNGVGVMDIDQCEVVDNVVADSAESQAGGLYLQGLQITFDDSAVARNVANSAGGLFVWENPGLTTFNMTNSTVAQNHTRASLGAGMAVNQNVQGTLWHVTIAGNSTAGPASFAAAISGGEGLLLKNTLIADNTKVFVWENTSCNHQHPGAGVNYQWPQFNEGGQSELRCTAASVFTDPQLGELGDYGGLSSTIPPLPGSPVIGTAVDCPLQDQRGRERPPGACTPGAVEP